jgi:hypothetical protein
MNWPEFFGPDFLVICLIALVWWGVGKFQELADEYFDRFR